MDAGKSAEVRMLKEPQANPCGEAQFKTAKHCLAFAGTFGLPRTPRVLHPLRASAWGCIPPSTVHIG
jgi:hypothetical protein